MTYETLFGELRSILQNPASIDTWDALYEHLDLWPADTLETLALPYALDIVGRWFDGVERAAPQRWAARLLEGQGAALLALANKLDVSDQQLSSAQLAALTASPHLHDSIRAQWRKP
jgi:hypothetical protein